MAEPHPYTRIVEALEERGLHVKRTGDARAVAQCPAHDDGDPSLSVSAGRVDDRGRSTALVYCHAGCATKDVMAALDMSEADLFQQGEATYRYDDGRTVVRSYPGGQRRFVQYRAPRGKATQLYRLSKVVEAVAAGVKVALAEGEKDVLALERIGVVATTAPQGAANFHLVDVAPLRGGDVVAVVDQDDAGARWARSVRSKLHGVARSLAFYAPKAGKDAADHVAAGYGIADFIPYTIPDDGDQEPLEVEDEISSAVTVRMSDVKPERIDWLWRGRLALGKLHIIDGDPGLGKSTIAGASWAATITTGGFWPDGTSVGDPRGVVILSAEDGLADTIRPRLDAHGADASRVVALTGIRRVDPDTGEVYEVPPVVPNDLTALEAAIREVDAAVVIVDPLMAYLGPDTNSYRDQDVRRALAPLAKLAERLGVAVVIIRHLRKSKGTAIYSGGGSIGIIGAARIAYTVGTDPEDESRYVIACSKVNIGTKPPALAYRLVPDELHGCARVQWLGEVEVSADQLTAERDRGDRTKLADATEWLLGYLQDQGGEVGRKDVMRAAAAAGFTRPTIERAFEQAKIGYRSGGFPRTTVWIHPDPSQSPQGATTGGDEVTEVTGLTSENEPNGAQSPHISNGEVTATTGVEACPDCGVPAGQRSDRCGFVSFHEGEPPW